MDWGKGASVVPSPSGRLVEVGPCFWGAGAEVLGRRERETGMRRWWVWGPSARGPTALKIYQHPPNSHHPAKALFLKALS